MPKPMLSTPPSPSVSICTPVRPRPNPFGRFSVRPVCAVTDSSKVEVGVVYPSLLFLLYAFSFPIGENTRFLGGESGFGTHT